MRRLITIINIVIIYIAIIWGALSLQGAFSSSGFGHIYGAVASAQISPQTAPQTDKTDLHKVDEIQAREIGRALRCVVCQNQSIEDSDAILAADMRELVRARLAAGDSSQQVIDFMRARYGDYVLLKPPLQTNTYLLWLGPFAALLLAGLWWLRALRHAPELEAEDEEV